MLFTISSPAAPKYDTAANRRRFTLATSFTTILPIVVVLLLSLVSATAAYEMEVDSRVQDSSLFRRMERRGEILVDRRDPPPIPLMSIEERQVFADSSTSTTSAITSDSTQSTTGGSPNDNPTATTPTSTQPTVTVITTPLPSPFDTSLGNNFTSSSCPAFFDTFLRNATFRSCVPMSLLLQNSNSFFRAERQSTLLSQTIDAACDASLAICSPLLSSMAAELIQSINCGQDYEQQNPLVMQAYNGLVAYEPLYKATCLKNTSSGNYCFAEAIVNATNAADAFPYYTAIGLSLPTGAQPTCSSCLKQTMQIFAGYAPSSQQPLAGTYLGCAAQIDAGCGGKFANTDVQVGTERSSSGGEGRNVRSIFAVAATTAVAVLWAMI